MASMMWDALRCEAPPGRVPLPLCGYSSGCCRANSHAAARQCSSARTRPGLALGALWTAFARSASASCRRFSARGRTCTIGRSRARQRARVAAAPPPRRLPGRFSGVPAGKTSTDPAPSRRLITGILLTAGRPMIPCATNAARRSCPSVSGGGGTFVSSTRARAPSDERRRVSYPVSDSVCCKRRANEPPRLVGRAHASTGVSR